MKLQMSREWFRDKSPLLYCLLGASWGSWRKTFTWFGFNMMGGLMPLWGTLILLLLHSQKFKLYDFISHGEFALYAAAFLAPALMQVSSNLKETKYVLGTGTVLFAVTALCVSVLVYSGVQPPQTVNADVLTRWSLILLPISVLFAVFVTLVDQQMNQPDPSGAEQENFEQLAARINQKIGIPQAENTSGVPPKTEDGGPSESELARVFEKSAAARKRIGEGKNV